MRNALILMPRIYVKEPDEFDIDRRISLSRESADVLSNWLHELGYEVYSITDEFDCSLEIPDDLVSND